MKGMPTVRLNLMMMIFDLHKACFAGKYTHVL